ncbi:MAG: NERD domain-containing protein [Actinobacteria bacterium]|nr:NERD domain-containing protein [Actinomycetota bacterium]
MSAQQTAPTNPSRRGESALLVLAVVGAGTTIAVSNGLAQVFAAGILGSLLTLAIVGWKVGGHVTSLVWLWVGKQKTEAVLRQLDDAWSFEHDIPHRRGMWDHVLVGPSGVYMLESKGLARPADVSSDALRSGRWKQSAGRIRGEAVALKNEFTDLGVQEAYVQPVVVVWGEFAQRRWEECGVAYVQGAELLDWLQQRPRTLKTRQVGTLRSAVRELAARA